MNHYFLTAILYRNLSAFDIGRIRNDGCSTDDHANRVCFSRIFPSCMYHLRGEIPNCGGQIKGKIPRHGCILTKSPYMRVMNLRFSQNKCMKWVP